MTPAWGVTTQPAPPGIGDGNFLQAEPAGLDDHFIQRVQPVGKGRGVDVVVARCGRIDDFHGFPFA
jgi:hypothetical protein